MSEQYMLLEADVLDALRLIESNSCDAAVTDPPYGLSTKEPAIEDIVAYLQGSSSLGPLRKGRKNCANSIVGIPVVPESNHSESKFSQGSITFRVMLSQLPVSADGVQLHYQAAGKQKIDNNRTSVEIDDVLMRKFDTEFGQSFDDSLFCLGKRESFSGCVETCGCLTELSPTSLSVLVRLRDNPASETKSSTGVVTSTATELRAVLTLDLGNRTGKLFLAEAADLADAGLSLFSSEPIGASSRTSRLATMIESILVGKVRLPTDRAVTIDISVPVTLVDRFHNPRVARTDFMNKQWELPPVEVWRELFRVLRPGAHALVFGGTRTFDLLTIGMRAAGFEVRNVFSYVYASGMPKSLNVSIAIDDKLGVKRPVIGQRVLTGNAALSTKEKGGTYGVQVGTAPAKTVDITGPATWQAAQFDDYGTDVKPCWEPIVLVRKPIDGTIANTAMVHGTGGLNIGGCRLEFASDADKNQSHGKVLGGGFRPDSVAHGDRAQQERMPYDAEGRWPPNFIVSHCHTEDEPCVPPCPCAELDAQSGDRPGMSGGGVHKPGYEGGMFGAINSAATSRGDNGGASRFMFTPHPTKEEREEEETIFRFCPKPSRQERELGCEHLPARSGAESVDREEGSAGVNNPRAGAGRTSAKVRNHHPTLKPIALIRWLATLLLPPVLDRPRRIIVPYSGSGSEMIGCMRAGWDEIVGIQRTANEDEASYITIAHARLKRWAEVPLDMDEKTVASDAGKEKKKVDPRQVSMFERVETAFPAFKETIAASDTEMATRLGNAVLPQAVLAPVRPALPATTSTELTAPVSAPVVPSPVAVQPYVAPTHTIGVSQEMTMSELAQRLAEKGHPYTLSEIAQWDTAKRLRAAKFVRGETP